MLTVEGAGSLTVFLLLKLEGVQRLLEECRLRDEARLADVRLILLLGAWEVSRRVDCARFV